MRTLIVFLAIVLLVSCAPSAPLTGKTVTDAFTKAGIVVTDVKPEERKADSPLPNSYTERLQFIIPRIAPKGGQLFVCDTKKNCDALFAYFDALKALAGPYTYQSDGGRVVIQLNDSLTPQEGAAFQAAITPLP